jgi:hypothetical protein
MALQDSDEAILRDLYHPLYNPFPAKPVFVKQFVDIQSIASRDDCVWEYLTLETEAIPMTAYLLSSAHTLGRYCSTTTTPTHGTTAPMREVRQLFTLQFLPARLSLKFFATLATDASACGLWDFSPQATMAGNSLVVFAVPIAGRLPHPASMYYEKNSPNYPLWQRSSHGSDCQHICPS